MTSTSANNTLDDFLGGRLQLAQPREGYRAGVDPVLLAAACPARPGDRVLDVGAGVGTAGLCVAARVPGVALTALEIQPNLAALALENAARNGQQMDVITADLTALPMPLRERQFAQVITNPPYFDRTKGAAASNLSRETGRGGQITLTDWLTACAKRVAPKGWLTLIARIEQLPEALAALPFGAIKVMPLAPRPDAPPKLFLLQARHSARTPFALLPAHVLHENTGYTAATQAILRDGAALTLS